MEKTDFHKTKQNKKLFSALLFIVIILGLTFYFRLYYNNLQKDSLVQEKDRLLALNVLLKSGFDHLKKGTLEKAYLDFKQAEILDPSNEEVLSGVAMCKSLYCVQKDSMCDEAINDLSYLINNKNKTDLYLLRASVKNKMGDSIGSKQDILMAKEHSRK